MRTAGKICEGRNERVLNLTGDVVLTAMMIMMLISLITVMTDMLNISERTRRNAPRGLDLEIG